MVRELFATAAGLLIFSAVAIYFNHDKPLTWRGLFKAYAVTIVVFAIIIFGAFVTSMGAHAS